mgnify:CR=1 FL=1
MSVLKQPLLRMSLLAALAGVLTSLVVVAFRLSIEAILDQGILPNGHESFEDLLPINRFLLAFLGAALLGLIISRIQPSSREVGISHVVKNTTNDKGELPLSNAAYQFFGGIIALCTGQSGGREGPAVHLGATSSSLLAKFLGLSVGSSHILMGCGAAAAIASSFNTPIAGIIFAMEVLKIRYSLSRFIPIIIAATSSTITTHILIGPDTVFTVPRLFFNSVSEMPFVVMNGLIIGALAACFVWTINRISLQDFGGVIKRTALAGLITGLSAILIPEVMGLGYDTISDSLIGDLTISSLLLILIFKTLTSAAACGLGLPVGVIGPTLVIGACAGALVSSSSQYFGLEVEISPALYAIVGMAAMMGAVLQAPLAALMAILELTKNTEIILPAMIATVLAVVVMRIIFRQKGVFEKDDGDP